ncbi:hypothetical protein BKA04_001212 [Cryobacterium mesophilum]|uniref:Uncharacterized protein n=1 Tax=Terrimesophilobacter mesophilus TaxID=433647 RepID=A0A4R8VBJ3_9MICO|nr:hypothetical protein [Terrimesophilobacter mesophilus]MBB5632989.1 hypothetical protein [Terrimesophilobacter mesophilus]TFB79756.1 hypothetical protein E3N84_06700 [Terrimesophilobacter mesophilus]
MRKRNPWIGALWFCAVVLVLGAFAAQVWQASFWYPSATDVSPGPVVRFLQQIADALVSPALYVGFGTIGGLLFLHARNRARRKS